MTEPTRLSPKTVREKVMQGDALLICAYDDAARCEHNRLSGALTLGELQDQLPDDRQLVFY